METEADPPENTADGVRTAGILIACFLRVENMDLMGIMVSTGFACDSKNTQISHVLKAIEADEKYALGAIRISLGRDNTNDEAVKIAEALISILKKWIKLGR